MGLHQTATRYNESMNPPLVELLALTRDWSRLRALPYNASEAALPTYAALFNACFDHLDNASRPTRNMEWILERDEHQILHAETLYRSARLVDAHWKASFVLEANFKRRWNGRSPDRMGLFGLPSWAASALVFQRRKEPPIFAPGLHHENGGPTRLGPGWPTTYLHAWPPIQLPLAGAFSGFHYPCPLQRGAGYSDCGPGQSHPFAVPLAGCHPEMVPRVDGTSSAGAGHRQHSTRPHSEMVRNRRPREPHRGHSRQPARGTLFL